MSGAEVVLGVVAGGAGLMSLSIQLAESSMKLTRAYHSMQNAPEAMKDVAHEIEIMSLSLKYLERHRQFAAHGADLLDRCIEKCRKHTGEIQHLVEKIVKRIGKAAFPGALYAVYKDSDLEKSLMDLARARSALHLAVELYHWEEEDRRWLSQQAKDNRSIQQVGLIHQTQCQQHYAVMHRLDLVLARLQPSGAKVEASSLGAGQVAGTSNTMVSTDYAKKHRSDDFEKRVIYRANLKLPAWFASFCSRVWDMAYFDADRGWDICLRTYHERPDGTEVFTMARLGDLNGIKMLIEQGEASFLDVTSEGLSLLGIILSSLRKLHENTAIACLRWLLHNRAPINRTDLSIFWDPCDLLDPQYNHAVLECLLSEFDSSLEFQDSYQLWFISTEFRSHEVLISKFRDALESLSYDDYVDFGTSLFNPCKTAAVYLRNCGLFQANPSLVTWRGQEGESALHHVAWALSKGRPENSIGWLNLGAALIQQGADLWALYKHEDWNTGEYTQETPLMALLSARHVSASFVHPFLPTPGRAYVLVNISPLTDLVRFLQSWNRMLKMAKVDILDYYAAEATIWRKLCPDISVHQGGIAEQNTKLQEVAVLERTKAPLLRLCTRAWVTVILTLPDRYVGSLGLLS